MSRLLGLLLAFAAAAPATAQLLVNKPADLSGPVVLAPGQAAIVIGFRRPGMGSLGKSGSVSFARYDIEKRDTIVQPKDAKKSGDMRTYWIEANGGDKKLPLNYRVMLVSPGDYVLAGYALGAGSGINTTSFCFSAPVISVRAGEIAYFGDVSPYFGKVEDGHFAMAMAYSNHLEEARAAMAGQPALAAGLQPGDVRNGASYTCASQIMTAYIAAGQPTLPPLTEDQKRKNFATGAGIELPTAATTLVPIIR